MAATSLPLAAAVVILLIVVSAVVVPAAGGGGKHGGARTVIVIRRGPGTRAAAGARASDNEWWRYGRGRLLEDEVAPELGGLFGAGQGGSLDYKALDKTRPVCPSSGECAAKGGGSYTRDCTYKDQCPH